MENIKVASICMNVTPNKAANIEKAKNLVRKAVNQEANWIVLPEMFSYMGPYKDLVANAEILEQSELVSWMTGFCEKHDVTIFAGSIPEKSIDHQKKVFNTSCIIHRNKGIIHHYQKIHLFNLISEDPKLSYREDQAYLPGKSISTIEIDGFNVLLAICYDLRFPQMMWKLAKNSTIDVIVIPAAFTKHTGKAHWHTLLKARAVDFQAYTVASNQTGISFNEKETFGHSLVYDPWGELLSDTTEKEGIAEATLEKNRLNEIRSFLPTKNNQVPEFY